MKNIFCRELRLAGFLGLSAAFFILSTGCKKTTDVAVNSQNDLSNAMGDKPTLNGFKKAVLNADVTGYGAVHIDANLHNAWGMSASDEGEIWVSAADGGVSFVYNVVGDDLMPAVTIPSHQAGVPGNPTGNIYNETPDFVIPGTGEPSEFLFASED